MNGKEEDGKKEEIYKILNEKKEINEKSPKLRTEEEKKKLKNLTYIISKFPKNLKRAAESEIQREEIYNILNEKK